jgi:DNA repair exonuclease SbcCD nuclease subunit
MEAVAIGDLHFDGDIAKYVSDHHLMIGRMVDKVCRWARKRGIRNVFFLGDACEGPRMSYESMMELHDTLRRNKDMEFWAIPGNHDLFAEDPAAGHSLEVLLKLSRIKNFHFFTKPADVDIDGALVRFLPWPSAKFSKKALNIAHVERKGSRADTGRVFKNEDFPDGKEICLIGHLHTKQKVRRAYYPGTLYQTNFGEREEKFFAHVSFNSVLDFEIEFIPFKPEYVLHNMVISSRSDLKKVPKDEHQLVKLIVDDGVDVDPSDWANKSNVVKVTPFKTKEELVDALTEDLVDGTSIVIETDDFIEAWFAESNIDPELQAHALKVRRRILKKPKERLI